MIQTATKLVAARISLDILTATKRVCMIENLSVSQLIVRALNKYITEYNTLQPGTDLLLVHKQQQISTQPQQTVSDASEVSKVLPPVIPAKSREEQAAALHRAIADWDSE